MMNTVANTAVLCITGWHYPEQSYARIASISDADVYVVSHKLKHEVPSWVFGLVPPGHILFEPNIGYDWGCYQQFIESGLWKNHEYIFFLHDDLVINDTGFVDSAIELLKGGKKFIGNGVNNRKTDWPRDYRHVYAPLGWEPPDESFTHETLRGSFIATTREALEQLDGFEVFWDWMHLNVGFGNWSLITTCGKIEHVFGPGCFGFLGEAYCKSDYLVEEVRGGCANDDVPHYKKVLADKYTAFCRWYVARCDRPDASRFVKLVEPLLHFVAWRGLFR